MLQDVLYVTHDIRRFKGVKLLSPATMIIELDYKESEMEMIENLFEKIKGEKFHQIYLDSVTFSQELVECLILLSNLFATEKTSVYGTFIASETKVNGSVNIVFSDTFRHENVLKIKSIDIWKK